MAGGALQDDLTFLLYYWIAVALSAFLAKWTRLSPLVYYLIFGMVLSNTHLVHGTDFLNAFTEVCITLVFFALGLEENVDHFMQGIRKAWGIASIGAIVPFFVGFCCTLLFWPESEMKMALMGGLAVTATAVSLTMISLKAEGLASSKPAIGIMTSAVLDDIASLALVAICTPIATGDAQPTPLGITWISGKAMIFFACVGFAHAVVFPHDIETGLVSHFPLVRKYGVKNVLSFQHGEQATFISLLIGLFFGLVAIWLGFHQTIGAYMAGLILEEQFYDLDEVKDGKGRQGDEEEAREPMPRPNTYQHTLHTIEDAAFCWLGPVFFVHLGATIPIDGKIISETIGYSLILFLLLFVGQFLSASIAARYVPGGFTWAESAMIGFGMLGRAELFFVVLNMCYVRHSILNTNQFFTFTTAALLLDICVPICISLYKPYFVRFSQIKGPSAASEPRDEEVVSTHSHSAAIWNFIHAKVHRQAAKRERRIFKPELDANHRPQSQTPSKKSSPRAEYSQEGCGGDEPSEIEVTADGQCQLSGAFKEPDCLPGTPQTVGTLH